MSADNANVLFIDVRNTPGHCQHSSPKSRLRAYIVLGYRENSDSDIRSKYADGAHHIFLRAYAAVDRPRNDVCSFDKKRELRGTSEIVYYHAWGKRSALSQILAFWKTLLTNHDHSIAEAIRGWPLHMPQKGKNPNEDEIQGIALRYLQHSRLKLVYGMLTSRHSIVATVNCFPAAGDL